MFPADPGVLVAVDAVEPGGIDGGDAQAAVGSGVVGVVHLLGVDRREDGAEVLPARGDGHAAVDQGPAADAAALVDGDAGELLGVQDPGVAVDVLVDGEAEEVAQRLLGPGPQPEGAVVGPGGVGEDLAVRARRVPGHAHLDHMDVDSGLGEPESGHGATVSGADDQDRHTGPGADRRCCRTDSRPRRCGVPGDRRSAQKRTCSSDESSTRDTLGPAILQGSVVHVTSLTLDRVQQVLLSIAW